LNIRNFSIIAHIDHGKSTLADRILELTGAVPPRQMREQILDDMELERERGITIKAKAVRLQYQYLGTNYIFNLIDTPGHVDFTYEVSRALAACEGAVLLVDATQGVEAQTLANVLLARQHNLKIIPVINKIDLPRADPVLVSQQIKDNLAITDEPILVSAKEGTNIDKVLQAIIEKIPQPARDISSPLAALIFDSYYDPYRGVIIVVRIFSGRLRRGQKIMFFSNKNTYEVQEIGYLCLGMFPSEELVAGEVGYIVAGIKNIHDVKIGDTITATENPVDKPRPGYREIKPFVFAGLYPQTSEYEDLAKALAKLHLSDAAFFYTPETSTALGFGFRCGFLGTLHLEIVRERLRREFGIDLLVTIPNVVYRIVKKDGSMEYVDNPVKFPSSAQIAEVFEPYVRTTIVLPNEYLGNTATLLQNRRARQIMMTTLEGNKSLLVYEMPLAEMIFGFYDALKSVSRGYASFDYEHIEPRPGNLVKLEVLLNQEPLDAFALIVHRDAAYIQAKNLAEKLKELIPRHLFEIPIQVRVDGRIIARQTIPAKRKDVLAKCYGGDITRKRKLLEKQKEGKKRMRQFGRVSIPTDAFLALLSYGNPSGKEK